MITNAIGEALFDIFNIIAFYLLEDEIERVVRRALKGMKRYGA